MPEFFMFVILPQLMTISLISPQRLFPISKDKIRICGLQSDMARLPNGTLTLVGSAQDQH